jgi:hypothetical protein
VSYFMPNGPSSSLPQPPSVDPDVPSPARVWNYWLGGTDNFPVDRELAERDATVGDLVGYSGIGRKP